MSRLFNGLKTKTMKTKELVKQYEQRVKNLHNSLRMAEGIAKARVSDKLYCANKTLDELNNLLISDVSNRRELLKAFGGYLAEQYPNCKPVYLEDIDLFLDSL